MLPLRYTDDNTFYAYSSNIQAVLNNLREGLEKLFQWVSANYLVANADKCHLLTSPKTAVVIHVSDATVPNKKRVKILGINHESRVNFDFHIDTLLTL